MHSEIVMEDEVQESQLDGIVEEKLNDAEREEVRLYLENKSKDAVNFTFTPRDIDLFVKAFLIKSPVNFIAFSEEDEQWAQSLSQIFDVAIAEWKRIGDAAMTAGTKDEGQEIKDVDETTDVTRLTGESLGKRIRRLRVENEWTQAELASRVGVSEGLVSHWETDRNKPSPKDIVRLGEVFKKDPSRVYTGLPLEEALAQSKTRGGWIKILRIVNGWTKKELASQVGVTQWQVIRWERNEYPPSSINIFKLGKIFNQDPSRSFTELPLDMARESITIGGQIRILRIVNEWTQAELASQVGVKERMVIRWETVEIQPTPKNFLKLGKLFDEDPSRLYTGLPLNEALAQSKTIGGRIKILRIVNGWTQKELASKVEVSQTMVFRWETVEIRPSPKNIRKLRKVFDVGSDTFRSDAAMVGTPRERVKLVDKIMTEIEEEMKAEGHNEYFEPIHGNMPYAGTSLEYATRAINDLRSKGLMESDKKFGDIGAGIGRMLAFAVVLTEVGEVIGIEADPYLFEKGQKAIDRLHDLKILDKKRIRWINSRWQDVSKEIKELDAVYIQPPMHQYDFAPWTAQLLSLMREDAYLHNSIFSGENGWGQLPAGDGAMLSRQDLARLEKDIVEANRLLVDSGEVRIGTRTWDITKARDHGRYLRVGPIIIRSEKVKMPEQVNQAVKSEVITTIFSLDHPNFLIPMISGMLELDLRLRKDNRSIIHDGKTTSPFFHYDRRYPVGQ